MVLIFPAGKPENNLHKTLNCGCKINLRLKVTGKRPDKLHELSSLFLFLEHPGDILNFSITDKCGIFLETPGFPDLDGENHLVCRSAELFARTAGITPCWKIILEKNVPVAAGLGGGSADAAGILSLLNDVYHAFSPEKLCELAFSIGADVPFFLNRRSAWVSGAGEKFEFPEKIPQIPELLIVNPGFPVSAKWAYTHLVPELIGQDDPELKAAFASGNIKCWQEFCRNDLAPALFEKFPLLTILKEHLLSCGASAVQVSGSGSSLFALFESGAEENARKLRDKFSTMNNMRIFAGGKEW